MRPSKNNIKIFGIDPGLTHTGCTICNYDPSKDTLQVATCFTIEAIALAKKENKVEHKQYGNIISLFLYERELDNIMSEYQPDYVASEDAFYNPRTPLAFVSLKLCINAIQRVLYKHGKILYRIAPKQAKQAVSTGTADKLAVQDAIQHLPDLIVRNTKQNPIEKISEHEADSIAIAYAFKKFFLPDLLMKK